MEQTQEEKRLELVLDRITRELDRAENVVGRYREELQQAQVYFWENLTHDAGDIDGWFETAQHVEDMNRRQHDFYFYLREKKRLQKMARSPYFGRIDFHEAGLPTLTPVYIGIASLADRETGEYWVYDWRAPISGMFYDFEPGPAEYKCPGGIIHGEITLKRQYRINNGHIIYMFNSSLKIDDDILQELLSKNTDVKMKQIITSIQREQNQIIRDEKRRVLVVQGAAGSGKTSIALHRAAYLLYRERDTLSAKNILIFSPNRIFNDYISNVLPELGEENILRTTFPELFQKFVGPELQIEEYAEQMEYLFGHTDDKDYEWRVKSICLKSHPDFFAGIHHLSNVLESAFMDFPDIVFDGKVLQSREELARFVRDSAEFLPLARRIEQAKERLRPKLKELEKELAKVEMQKLKDAPEYYDEKEIRVFGRLNARAALDPVKKQIDSWASIDPVRIYQRLFEDEAFFRTIFGATWSPDEWTGISRVTLDRLNRGQLGYEDGAALFYLKGILTGFPAQTAIRHIIIDEAQDYGLFHYEIIKRLFPRSSFTILGDLNQAIHPYLHLDSYETIRGVFAPSVKAKPVKTDKDEDPIGLLRLTKSYRSTREIADFTAALLPVGEIDYIRRPGGELPFVINMKERERMHEVVAKEIKDLQRQGFDSVAVLTKTTAAGQALYEKLHSFVDIHLVTNDNTELHRGAIIIPAYLAKGLEFDAVLIYDADATHYHLPEERKLFYTACTRALHRLRLYYSGEPTTFLEGIGPELYRMEEG